MLKFVLAVFSVLLLGSCHKLTDTSYPTGRVVGGESADISDYPFMLQVIRLGFQEYFWCGAALIDNNWAITAASCTYKQGIEDLVLVANTTERDSNDSVRIGVSKIYQNEHFDANTLDSDISLLQLETPVNCTYCKPISIGSVIPSTGENSSVFGWGLFNLSITDLSDTLRIVDVPIVDQEQCVEAYEDFFIQVTENMICAGEFETGGKDACTGDTGGPLVVNESLVGLASWGNSCAQPEYPGVYTMVPNFLEWISNITGIAYLV